MGTKPSPEKKLYVSKFEGLAGGVSDTSLLNINYGAHKINLLAVQSIVENAGPANMISGYLQEAGLYRFLEKFSEYYKSKDPSFEFSIYASFAVVNGEQANEIDTALVTNKGVYIFETKSAQGSFIGDSADEEWLRETWEGQSTKTFMIKNPIIQLERERKTLRNTIRTNIPIYKILVISSFSKFEITDISKINQKDLIITSDTMLFENLENHLDTKGTYDSNSYGKTVYQYEKMLSIVNKASSEANMRKRKNKTKKFVSQKSKERRGVINQLAQANKSKRILLPIVDLVGERVEFKFSPLTNVLKDSSEHVQNLENKQIKEVAVFESNVFVNMWSQFSKVILFTPVTAHLRKDTPTDEEKPSTNQEENL